MTEWAGLRRLNLRRGLLRLFVVFACCWYAAAIFVLWPLWVSANRAVTEARSEMIIPFSALADGQATVPNSAPTDPWAATGLKTVPVHPDPFAGLHTIPAEGTPLPPPPPVVSSTQAARRLPRRRVASGRIPMASPPQFTIAPPLPGAQQPTIAPPTDAQASAGGSGTPTVGQEIEQSKFGQAHPWLGSAAGAIQPAPTPDRDAIRSALGNRPIGLTVFFAAVPAVLFGLAWSLLWVWSGFRALPGAENLR